jgi:transposase InsO family protein
VKFAFIRDHLPAYPVTTCCRVLEVSRSGYYAWRQREPGVRQRRREELLEQITQVHRAHRGVYGSPRVYQVLKAAGEQVCENTVAKIMRQHGLRAKGKRRFVPRTTDSSHANPVAENLLDRQFTAEAPNRRWVADITYVPTDEGWLYVAAMLDLYSRKAVGWSMKDHLGWELVGDALRMGLSRRRPTSGMLHHSDRGVQYTCEDYQQLLALHGMTVSMSGVGNCYDNAAMESFWATLKTELVHHEHYATREAARQSIFEYIEAFYNRIRLHSSLGYVSPEAFEAAPD